MKVPKIILWIIPIFTTVIIAMEGYNISSDFRLEDKIDIVSKDVSAIRGDLDEQESVFNLYMQIFREKEKEIKTRCGNIQAKQDALEDEVNDLEIKVNRMFNVFGVIYQDNDDSTLTNTEDDGRENEI